MLSSNVQSIDLLMDCTAWRSWTMRQSNGYSTPAPRSSAAKQWLEDLAQKKKNRVHVYILVRIPHNWGKQGIDQQIFNRNLISR